MNKVKVEVDGVQYAVLDTGEGEETLMLLHGFTGSIENWSAHLPIFRERCRVVAVDLLGHGNTASPTDVTRYTIEHAAADLTVILDQLHIHQVNLLGYSMGGRLALYVALSMPERVKRLLLESASPGLEREEERFARIKSDEALADAIEGEGIEVFVDKWEKLPLFATQNRLPEGVRLQHRQLRLQNNPVGLANSLRGMGTGRQPSLWKQLHQLSMPTMLIAGKMDSKFVQIAKAMQMQIPRAELEIIPDAGHTVHLEQPARYDQHILQFLA